MARQAERPVKRDNQYTVSTPAEPELSNAVGIYQDGNDFS